MRALFRSPLCTRLFRPLQPIRMPYAAGCVVLLLGLSIATQQMLAQQIIGRIDDRSAAQEVKVAGAITVQGTTMLLGNGSTVTAGQHTLAIHLTRGGDLDLCATTSVHLSQQKAATDPNSPLMMALDHGALEAHYTLGKDSDVVLTPDLRILLSGPGNADVRIRVNKRGDTCVENRGTNAPYLTVSEQMGDGVYRVQPNQHVLFEHGSLQAVVDNEQEPCGCPATPIISIASAGSTDSSHVAKPGQTVAANASSEENNSLTTPTTPDDTAFPIAESEGLAPPPGPPTKPVVPPGQVHAEVTTTLAYSGPDNRVSSPTTDRDSAPASVTAAPTPEGVPEVSTAAAATVPAIAQTAPPAHKSSNGLFHHIGHFFARIFGKG